MSRLFLLLTICVISLISMNFAQAATCYSRAEMEAEQALRIHSELMVVSLNCQHMSHDRGNLYILYREFTRKHHLLLPDYERRMLSFFTRSGSRKPEKSLHTLRTHLANNVAQDAANMRPDLFCKAYSDRIPDALRLSGSQIKGWASTRYPEMSLSRPICANTNKSYNKG